MIQQIIPIINMKNELDRIVLTIKNSNKIQTIKKHHPHIWSWLKNEIESTYPFHEISEKEFLYLFYHPNTSITCKCGKIKKYYNGKYWCLKSCPYTKLARKKTVKKKYGVDHYSQSEKCKEKVKETVFKNYGVFNPSCSDILKEKKKTTTLKNFGVEFPTQNIDVKNKIRTTNLEKYGEEYYSKTEDYKNKTHITNLKRYGVKDAISFPDIREKIIDSNLKKLGVEFPFQSPKIQEKIKEINLKKYGYINHTQLHFSDLAKEILGDKIKFSEALLQYGADELSKKLGVSWSTIQRTHSNFDLNIMSLSFSSYEKTIRTWLDSHSITYILNSRDIIYPFEIDIYIPSHNLAIEFDGLYWHSENKGKDKFYHANKTKMANEKGIRLIHIFEDEWIHKKDICLDLIGRILGVPKQRIFARKCITKEISNSDAKLFLEKNHLQGYTGASINIGLFYENEMIQLMSFKKARYNKKIQWENIRCCNKTGVTVIGGIQKTWKHFLRFYSPLSVISYCDLRWFVGETYKKLNYSLLKVNPPQYWYIQSRDKRFHRSHFMKKRCYKLLPDMYKTENLTENQITRDILYLNKIWDCGQQVWIWKEFN